jgi:hypothetical protein
MCTKIFQTFFELKILYKKYSLFYLFLIERVIYFGNIFPSFAWHLVSLLRHLFFKS